MLRPVTSEDLGDNIARVAGTFVSADIPFSDEPRDVALLTLSTLTLSLVTYTLQLADAVRELERLYYTKKT